MKPWIKRLNNHIYYGWMIVFLSALTFFMSSPGQTYSISIFNNIYKDTFSLSSTEISTAYSLATVLSGVLLVFMGRAVDRFGARRMSLFVGVMLALTTFFNSYVTGLWMMFAGFFFLRYFGQGSMTLIPSALVPQWFEKKRAFAMSMSTVGSFIATLTVPALNLFMISTLGWQAAWRVWGIILLIVFVPAVLILGVNRPEDIGLVIDNGETVETTDESIRRMNAESFTVREAVRTKEFWFLGIISAIPAMFTTGLTFHFFSMMSTKGITNEAAAVIIGLIAFPSFLMPILARPVVDRFKTNRLLTVTLMMMVLSMVFLVIGVTNQVTAIVFILFYGLSIAIQSITLNVAWPNYFGRKHLGSVRGAATVFMVIGSALGPMPFGINADLTGDYDMVILMMAAITLMVTMTTFFMRKPIRAELI